MTAAGPGARLFDPPHAAQDPGLWAGMELVAGTVLLEAAGEPFEGKLAVAYVIENLMALLHTDAYQVILGKDRVAYADGVRYERFSCWNDDYAPMARARLTAPGPAVWEDCMRAAAAARWRFLPDPTNGADHYLNIEQTRRDRALHDLPAWVDLAKTTATVGKHTFLKLGTG